MQKFIFIAATFLTALLVGCGTTVDTSEQAKVAQQQEEFQRNQPIPHFDFSLERDAAIQLYHARNENVRTWTVWRSDYGMIEGFTPSLGYPIPYDSQLTNPVKVTFPHRHVCDGYVIEQPEPSGLYSSKNSIATWVRSVITRKNKTYVSPIYIEGKVTCYAYPVTVDYEKNRVVPLEDAIPTVTLKEGKK